MMSQLRRNRFLIRKGKMLEFTLPQSALIHADRMIELGAAAFPSGCAVTDKFRG
jgi:hypothetical protein